MNRLTHSLPILLMLLLGGMSLWLKQTIEGPVSGPRQEIHHEPDAMVDRFSVTRLDEHGRPELRLSADRMVHYSDDDSTELKAPQLSKNEAEATLSVRADRGLVTRDYDQAYFYDNVRLTRQSGADQPGLQVATQYLHVAIRQDLLTTDKPVTITQGQSVLSGTGMEYDRKSGRLSLLSDVKATVNARPR